MAAAVPDPALKRLQRLIGTWELTGRTLDSKVNNVTGRLTAEWLPGGFFLRFGGEFNFRGTKFPFLEVIGYDPSTENFLSTIYPSFSGTPIKCHWNIQGDQVTRWTEEDQFAGTFSNNGRTLSFSRRPADGSEDFAWDAVVIRVD